MAAAAFRGDAIRLVDEKAAQLAGVLPHEEYGESQLQGVINIPL